MKQNEFIQPFYDYPKSLIINQLNGDSYTYREFYKEVSNVDTELRNQRILKNSIVVIYGFKSSFKIMVLFFYCVKNGLIPFIVEQGNYNSIEDLNYNILLAPETLNLDTVVGSEKEKFKFGKVYQNSNQDLYIGDSNSFVIVSSSGSTSNIAKKILLGKKETLNNIRSNQKVLGIGKDDITLIILPLSYSYGLIAQFLSHFLAGANIILTDKTLGILQLSSILNRYNITNLFMTPLMVRLFFNYCNTIKSTKNKLKFITVGGNRINKKDINRLRKFFECVVYLTYGLAEAGPRVATKKIDPKDIFIHDIGELNPGVKIVVEEDPKYQKICGVQEVGRLCIQTNSMYLGYVSGRTLKKSADRNELKTNDICVKENKKIFLKGRVEDYIVLGSNRVVWFSEIEDNLYEDVNVLKVKTEKRCKDKLHLTIYCRKQDTVCNLSRELFSKYGLDSSECTIEVVEFNNLQYK